MTNMMTKNDQTMRIQIADDNKVWMNSSASVLVKLFEAPTDLYIELLKAETELLKSARQQRIVVDKLIDWLKSQEVQQ